MTVSYPQFYVSLVLLGFLWLVFDWVLGLLLDRAEATRVANASRECHICGKRYVEEGRIKLSECPDCSAQNVRGGHRKLG